MLSTARGRPVGPSGSQAAATTPSSTGSKSSTSSTAIQPWPPVLKTATFEVHTNGQGAGRFHATPSPQSSAIGSPFDLIAKSYPIPDPFSAASAFTQTSRLFLQQVQQHQQQQLSYHSSHQQKPQSEKFCTKSTVQQAQRHHHFYHQEQQQPEEAVEQEAQLQQQETTTTIQSLAPAAKKGKSGDANRGGDIINGGGTSSSRSQQVTITTKRSLSNKSGGRWENETRSNRLIAPLQIQIPPNTNALQHHHNQQKHISIKKEKLHSSSGVGGSSGGILLLPSSSSSSSSTAASGSTNETAKEKPINEISIITKTAANGANQQLSAEVVGVCGGNSTSTAGCSRTTPLIWTSSVSSSSTTLSSSGSNAIRLETSSLIAVKQEPCQVSEITTSHCSPPSLGVGGHTIPFNGNAHHSVRGAAATSFVKIEPASPTTGHHSGAKISSVVPVMDSALGSSIGGASNNGNSQYTAGQIPVGIAVARQRLHQEQQQQHLTTCGDGQSSSSKGGVGGAEGLGARFGPFGDLSNLGQNIFLAGPAPNSTTMIPFAPDTAAAAAVAMGVSNVQNQMRTPPALWQYPIESMLPMPVGLQIVRDPSTGQYLFLPTTALEPFQQTVVWPSYPQSMAAAAAAQSHLLLPSSHAINNSVPSAVAPPLPPPLAPLQFIGSSDYLTASTTLHQQHTQTQSTRLVALTNNDLKHRYGGGGNGGGNGNSSMGNGLNKSSQLLPTLIKIEDSHHSALTSNSDLLAPVQNSGLALQPTPQFPLPYPILTPTPNIFDLSDKTILNSTSQQISTNTDLPTFHHHPGSDMNIFYPIPTSHADLSTMPTPGNSLANVAILDTTSTANLIINHDSMNLSRSGGLLTPPSPITNIKPIPGILSNPSSVPFIGNSSVIPENESNAALDSIKQSAPEVQDAIMQTDTPVMSEDENTQDTITSNGDKNDHIPSSCDENSNANKEPMDCTTKLSSTSSQCHISRIVDVAPIIMKLEPLPPPEEQTQEEPPESTEAIKQNNSQMAIIGATATNDLNEEETATTTTTTSAAAMNMESKEGESKKSVAQTTMSNVMNVMPQRQPVDLSGLELLSNSIEAFEKKTFIKTEGPIIGGANKSAENMVRELTPPPVLQPSQPEESRPEEMAPELEQQISSQRPNEEQFDGLNLLCALAEQRLEEVVVELKTKKSSSSSSSGEKSKHKKHQKSHHKHKDGRDSERKFNLKRSYLGAIGEKKSDECEDKFHNESTEETMDHCHKKRRKSKSSKCGCSSSEFQENNLMSCENTMDKYTDIERDMRLRLADLTRQCEEKRRELDKMDKINPFYRVGNSSTSMVNNKFNMSDDEETRSSRSMSVRTPLTPTLLFGQNNSNSQANHSIISPSHFSSPASMSLVELPKLSSDTESSKYDENESSSVEKLSKRKGGVPKKHDDCSETETIVTKKTKNFVGYIFSNKNRAFNNSSNSGFQSNSALKKIDFRGNSPSSVSSSSETQRPSKLLDHVPLKMEDIKIKQELIDEDQEELDCSENNPFAKTPSFGDSPQFGQSGGDLFKQHKSSKHGSKHKKCKNKERKHHRRSSEAKERRRKIDEKCKLTEVHLDDKDTKSRVLTCMGGLFYAGLLSPIQPPDIYSVTLDGERGNRPHIMSREEILRDAILEIAPADPSDIPPGTRLCAYWSQQYRCLYPGTAAEPGSPDIVSDKKYVSVEFDDGDNGRIAIEDIRFLMSDYPIVDYDPNPLLSLGKRKRQNSQGNSTVSSDVVPTTTTIFSFASCKSGGVAKSRGGNSENVIDGSNGNDKEAQRQRRRLKKLKKQKLRQSSLECIGIPGNNAEAEASESAEFRQQRRKSKCTDEFCKHRKHKKRRKHKKHHHSKEEKSADEKVSDEKCGGEKRSINVETVDEKPGSVEGKEQQEEAQKIVETEDTETMDSFDVNDPDFQAEASKSRNNSVSGVSSTKKKDSGSPEQNKSKIAAFLPARQLWAWAGKSYRRSCVKGRVKKQFFKTIQRGKETIDIGDSAVFLSTGRSDRPYIGRIISMWKTNSCNMIVRVKWFYHPEETEGCPSLKYPGALFESPHEDENDVQTISHKCEVLGVADFTKKYGPDTKNYVSIYDNNDTYYLAGYYDPTALNLTMQPNIPLQ